VSEHVQIEAYPYFLNRGIDLLVNEQPVTVRFSSTEWGEFWKPFLTKFAEVQARHTKRLMVGIAGPPGSGKSTFAEQLAWLLNKGIIKGCYALALGIEGFAYNSYTLKNTKITIHHGIEVYLAQIKGSPETFDMPNLRTHLKELHDLSRESCGWPGYSKLEADIAPNRHLVFDTHNVVIVEGNYLLVNDERFAGIADEFDLKVYVDAPGAKIVSSLMAKHLKAGRTIDTAKSWVKQVDLPNAQLVEHSRGNADVIVLRGSEDQLLGLEWQPGKPVEKMAG
jgi:pantothenate kinase